MKSEQQAVDTVAYWYNIAADLEERLAKAEHEATRYRERCGVLSERMNKARSYLNGQMPVSND